MSNRSVWLDFPLVRNDSWHHGNLVLIGDAAHTAHFSIGSGTKLAMEDAIALANSFVRHPSDVEQALVDYELERQPVVERFQQAAGDSAAYFGRVGNYLGLEPIQFAANLLTRSGRISHANLTQRDPQFMRVLDAWFAADAAGADDARRGRPAPDVRAAAGRRRDRCGTGSCGVRRTAAARRRRAGADRFRRGRRGRAHDAGVPGAGRLVGARRGRRSHEAGALFGVRLGHAGRRGATRADGRRGRAAAGGVAAAVRVAAAVHAVQRGAGRDVGRADMARVRDDFVAAAGRARAAGFDVLELDLADGYLLASFLSPLTNRRDRRLRRAAALPTVRCGRGARGVAAAAGGSADGHRLGARRADRRAGHRARPGAWPAHGVDLVHVRAGHTTATSRPEYRRGYLTTLSDRVRNEAGRADAGRRLPDDAGRGEHGGRRRARGPVPVRAAARARSRRWCRDRVRRPHVAAGGGAAGRAADTGAAAAGRRGRAARPARAARRPTRSSRPACAPAPPTAAGRRPGRAGAGAAHAQLRRHPVRRRVPRRGLGQRGHPARAGRRRVRMRLPRRGSRGSWW